VKVNDDCLATQCIAGILVHCFSSISNFGTGIPILVSGPIGGQILGSDMSTLDDTPHLVGA
jgi:hypothetical protein